MALDTHNALSYIKIKKKTKKQNKQKRHMIQVIQSGEGGFSNVSGTPPRNLLP